jgi:hypothetical protein
MAASTGAMHRGVFRWMGIVWIPWYTRQLKAPFCMPLKVLMRRIGVGIVGAMPQYGEGRAGRSRHTRGGATAEPIISLIDGVIPAVTLQKPRMYLAVVASERQATFVSLLPLPSYIHFLSSLTWSFAFNSHWTWICLNAQIPNTPRPFCSDQVESEGELHLPRSCLSLPYLVAPRARPMLLRSSRRKTLTATIFHLRPRRARRAMGGSMLS